MSLSRAKRTLGAVVLVAVFFLAAVPARAAEGPTEREGFFGWLAVSAMDGVGGWLHSVWAGITENPTDPLDGEGGYVDPNGKSGTGCESTPEGCTPGGVSG